MRNADYAFDYYQSCSLEQKKALLQDGVWFKLLTKNIYGTSLSPFPIFLAHTESSHEDFFAAFDILLKKGAWSFCHDANGTSCLHTLIKKKKYQMAREFVFCLKKEGMLEQLNKETSSYISAKGETVFDTLVVEDEPNGWINFLWFMEEASPDIITEFENDRAEHALTLPYLVPPPLTALFFVALKLVTLGTTTGLASLSLVMTKIAKKRPLMVTFRAYPSDPLFNRSTAIHTLCRMVNVILTQRKALAHWIHVYASLYVICDHQSLETEDSFGVSASEAIAAENTLIPLISKGNINKSLSSFRVVVEPEENRVAFFNVADPSLNWNWHFENFAEGYNAFVFILQVIRSFSDDLKQNDNYFGDSSIYFIYEGSEDPWIEHQVFQALTFAAVTLLDKDFAKVSIKKARLDQQHRISLRVNSGKEQVKRKISAEVKEKIREVEKDFEIKKQASLEDRQPVEKIIVVGAFVMHPEKYESDPLFDLLMFKLGFKK